MQDVMPDAQVATIGLLKIDAGCFEPRAQPLGVEEHACLRIDQIGPRHVHGARNMSEFLEGKDVGLRAVEFARPAPIDNLLAAVRDSALHLIEIAHEFRPERSA